MRYTKVAAILSGYFVASAQGAAQSPIPVFDLEAVRRSPSTIQGVFSTRNPWSANVVDVCFLAKPNYSMAASGWHRVTVPVSNTDISKTRWRFTLPVQAFSSGWVMVLIHETSEYGIAETSYVACPYSTKRRPKRAKRRASTRPGALVPIILQPSEYASLHPSLSAVPGDVRLWTPIGLGHAIDLQHPYRLRFRQSSQTTWSPGSHWSAFELVPPMTKFPLEKRVHFQLMPTISHGLYFVQCLERHVYTGSAYNAQYSGVIREF